MKQTKSKINLEQFQKDIAELSNNEFEKRYPGVTKAQVQGLSDSKLAEIAGGMVIGTKSTGPLLFRG